jgi:hypothetical protein
MAWHDIRDPDTDHLLFQYDPQRQLISIRHRGKDVLVDLWRHGYRTPPPMIQARPPSLSEHAMYMYDSTKESPQE